ncbi:MAG: hypothetical protein EAY75_03455, partial [Bacteroidetes bacterium]
MGSSKRYFFLAATLGQGGAEKQFYYLVKAMVRQGHNIVVGCFASGEFWQPALEALGVRVVHLDAVGKLGRLRQLYKLIKLIKPELVFSMHFYSNFYLALPARLLGIKAIGSIRGNGYHEYHELGYMLAAVCYYTPHRVLANSAHGSANMKKIFPMGKAAQVFENSIDTSDYAPVGLKTVPEVPVLLLIARLVPLKRAELFLQLLEKLTEMGHSITGVVVGYGPEED